MPLNSPQKIGYEEEHALLCFALPWTCSLVGVVKSSDALSELNLPQRHLAIIFAALPDSL